jgi:hypothetical protein
MKQKLCIPIIAGALLVSAVVPLTAQAGRGSGAGTNQQTQTQDRLRDGSCTNSTTTQAGNVNKSGNIYGPGDGTGNPVAPKDGTGYGGPSKK